MLGEGPRLLVPVAHDFETGLISTYGGHDVVGLGERGDALRLAKRGHCGLVAPILCESDSGERVCEREMTPLAGGVESGSSSAQVFADSCSIADAPVAEGELVVS